MERSSHLLDEALGIINVDNSLSSSSSSSSLPSSSMVLIEDCVETSGAFVIHHILKRSLSPPSTNTSVVFVSLSHPFSHYDRILRKLGCNLSAHRDNRRFFFFDMLMLECPGRSEANTHKGGLIELYGKIQRVVEEITSSCSSKHITIIIDDFSLIEVAAKGSLNHSLDFLRYCYTLTSEVGCSIVILNHEDIYSGEESATLILQMEYLANVLIKAEPLATGLAADVHGQLTILSRGLCDQSRTSTNKTQNFHFKLKENGVECFYPGTRT